MAKGYHAAADLLTRTRDGQDLNELWDQYAEALAAYNATRQPLIDLLSVQVTDPIVDTTAPGTEDFEEATEYGIAVAKRPLLVPTARAYPFKWWDMRAAYTWQFLQKASRQQLDNVMNMAVEAENRLVFLHVMRALFNSANRTTLIDGASFTVEALYNADSRYIPSWDGVDFDSSTHTHYVYSGNSSVDSKDLEDLAALVEEHGFTPSRGFDIIIMVNKQEGDVIKTFQRGVTNNNSVKATFDFIPATGTGFQLPVGWQVAAGSQQSPTLQGLDVIGSYGSYIIVQNGQIPAGYMVAVATAGRNSPANVIGIREDSNPSLRGLVLKPGNNNNYPLIDSHFIRGLGAGVAEPGAAAVMRVHSSAYAVPSAYQY